jgi:hypothetical protein
LHGYWEIGDWLLGIDYWGLVDWLLEIGYWLIGDWLFCTNKSELLCEICKLRIAGTFLKAMSKLFLEKFTNNQ